MTRPEMIEKAVVEAARQFVAANLRAERKACSVREDEGYAAYQDAVNASMDALQDLRDTCSAQSRVRVRR